ncbi:Modification methylase DpnIIB [Anatilimnocola aggregata]|uniref:Methyltransferase n=1 Tax=Anatilimnocola aggregata TaxID=2528021 RepID=A0A517Y6L4_9BACT|nr:site-specific DNA-methyltransferase [Anatilimnocola aggregata]QDU25878.1 Modification methylase DpnIIB [Anatilimnocola aggregata]
MKPQCEECPLTSKDQQDAVIDATIRAAYLDPHSPTSHRAIASMLPAWIKADHKRVGRRVGELISTGALPQLNRRVGLDGKLRQGRKIPRADVADDFQPQVTLLCGDAEQQLRKLDDDSVDCCVTSPPYFLQMDVCADQQIGQEQSVDQYIARLAKVFDEVRRTLRRTGTLWINIGDTFRDGQSLLVPQRLALALTSRGWKLRGEIIVEKSNPAPRRYEGRLSPTHETLLVFALNVPHYFDVDSLRLDFADEQNWGLARHRAPIQGTVWRLPPVRHEDGGHPAPMPIELARHCVTLGCPPDRTVLDPFAGIGTSLIAAVENYRHGIGIELSPYYLSLARQRLPKSSLV